MIRVTVAREHVDAQSMNLTDIHGSAKRRGEAGRALTEMHNSSESLFCKTWTYFPSTASTILQEIFCSYNTLSMRSRRSVLLFRLTINTYVYKRACLWVAHLKWVVKRTFWHHSFLTSSNPILSGFFLGTRIYLDGITGGLRAKHSKEIYEEKISSHNSKLKASWTLSLHKLAE